MDSFALEKTLKTIESLNYICFLPLPPVMSHPMELAILLKKQSEKSLLHATASGTQSRT